MFEHLYSRSPLFKHIATSPPPGTFGAEYSERDGEAVFRYYEEVRKIGTASNLTVPLKKPHDSAKGFIVAGGPRSKEEFERFLDDHGDTLLSAIHYADAYMLNLLEAEGLANVEVSPREIECLKWLSEGLMNDRIAERMKISEVTVRLHLQNIRRKLKSATREQALVKALKLGLLFA